MHVYVRQHPLLAHARSALATKALYLDKTRRTRRGSSAAAVCTPAALPQVPALYPFGWGLSYATFRHSVIVSARAGDAAELMEATLVPSAGAAFFDVTVTVSAVRAQPASAALTHPCH